MDLSVRPTESSTRVFTPGVRLMFPPAIRSKSLRKTAWITLPPTPLKLFCCTRRDELAVLDAGQRRVAVAALDVTDDLRVGVGPAEDQIERAGAAHRGAGQIAQADHLDRGAARPSASCR